MNIEGLCDTCANIEDCPDWLDVLRTDDLREKKRGWVTRGIRTLTVVYDCSNYGKRATTNKEKE